MHILNHHLTSGLINDLVDLEFFDEVQEQIIFEYAVG